MSNLFQPVSLSSLHLRNHFAMAPMTRVKSPGGIPNDENVEYYRQRAAGGVGLIISEGTLVRGPAAGPSPDIPRMYGDASAEGWAKVVAAVHAEGGSMAPQLWHLGVARGAASAFEPEEQTVSPSGVDPDGVPTGRVATRDDLDAIVASFVESATMAKAIGFDGIELHGAHGYLLDQFLWERTNHRDDEYGGSIERRSAFPAEVVAAVRNAVGPDFPIIFRYSQWKGTDYEALLATTPAELEQVLAPLVGAGVDIFHVSTRRHWVPGFPGDPTGLAGWTKRVTGRPVITVGSVGVETVFRSEDEAVPLTSRERFRLLEEQFDRGEFDLVALGRALLSDPAWVAKAGAGRWDEIEAFSPQPA
jgi:2,4-dienoyl-CoA reductase-like NADH-dependent reductase (Old Yellow Enzyme family)